MLIPHKTNNKEKKIIFITGAGLDAPSGIQTFRGANGLWNDKKIMDICHEDSWRQNFEIVHDFYNHRRIELGKAKPNLAHKTIKKITEKYGSDNVYHITQNVTNLNEQVGAEVLHLHGELTKMRCEHCGNVWDIGYETFDITKDTCPKCKNVKDVRPHIVMFGSPAPMYSYLYRAIEFLDIPETIVIIIGTQGNVIPIEAMLKGTRATKILANMEKSYDLPEKRFDKIYYESIETSILKIEADIEELWGEPNE